jgi:hypothetical protein
MNEDSGTVEIEVGLLRELVLAANVLTEVWGVIGGGEAIDGDDLDDRLEAAGLGEFSSGTADGDENLVFELSDDFISAIETAAELTGDLGHEIAPFEDDDGEEDERSDPNGFAEDVAAAEARIAQAQPAGASPAKA